jgi:hypothetical protein
MGYRQPIAELAELTVWYRPSYPGRQVLLWRFDNMCDAPAPGDTLLRAYVDATTGELVSLMRKLGSSTPGMKHSGEQEKVDSSDKPAPVLIRAFKKVDMPALKNATPPPTVFQSARPRKK